VLLPRRDDPITRMTNGISVTGRRNIAVVFANGTIVAHACSVGMSADAGLNGSLSRHSPK
jgi:hypothetical protein